MIIDDKTIKKIVYLYKQWLSEQLNINYIDYIKQKLNNNENPK